MRKVQYAIDEQREGKMSLEEATYWMYNYLPRWREENPGKLAPELTDGNPYARNIARAIQVVRNYKIQLQKKDNV